MNEKADRPPCLNAEEALEIVNKARERVLSDMSDIRKDIHELEAVICSKIRKQFEVGFNELYIHFSDAKTNFRVPSEVLDGLKKIFTDRGFKVTTTQSTANSPVARIQITISTPPPQHIIGIRLFD